MKETVQFGVGGPELPLDLLKAHEDGRLVFYCGAGISKANGLPLYSELVDEIYAHLGEKPSLEEEAAKNSALYDRVLSLLEVRVGPDAIREFVVDRLRTAADADSPVHRSLLGLASPYPRSREPRLITTNYDLLFESTARKAGFKFRTEAAPRLAVPKDSRWNTLVYLHGRLDEDSDGSSFVLTSADFGVAYLVERWAARFVTELFARYTVLFVGYSLEDPVLRYITDALAAEARLPGVNKQMYALAEAAPGAEKNEARRWLAKGVTPILYDNSNHHARLGETLHKWCTQWEAGIVSRQNLARSVGAESPIGRSPVQRSRFFWALENDSALRAFVSAPDAKVEWLGELDGRDGPGHLRQGEQPLTRISDALVELAVRNLTSRWLIDYVVEHGGQIHPNLAHMIRRRLMDPGLSGAIRGFWTLLADPGSGAGVPSEHSGMSGGPLTRVVLLRMLQPKQTWQAPVLFSVRKESCALTPLSLGIMALSPAGGSYIDLVLTDLQQEKPSFLVGMTFALTELLVSYIDLFRVAGRATDATDPSMLERPSIAAHEQNSNHYDWTQVVDILLLAFELLEQQDTKRARMQWYYWLSLPSPLFRRLALSAAANTNILTSDEKIGVLLGDE